MFGLSGKVLESFQSYLKECSQTVSGQGALSDVTGPLFFTMYIQPLGFIARWFGVDYQFYADDTQLYVPLELGNESKVPSSLENLEHCLADIRLGMTQNLLQLNDGKTDIIYPSSSYNAKSLQTPGLQIGELCITRSSSVRDIGVIFDQFLNMNGQPITISRISAA